MTSSRTLFLGVLLTTFVLDLATKLFVMFGLEVAVRQPIQVLPFMDFILVWNRGISYGLFQQSTEFGRWALTIFKLVAGVGLMVWAWRSGEARLNLGLGLIAGGAFGNALDRVLYGAVFDFVHLHWGTFSWYVFNIADAAIVVGVLVLLYDSIRSKPPASEKP